MCKMKLTAVYNKDIVLQNERFSAAIIYRGRPKSDTPIHTEIRKVHV